MLANTKDLAVYFAAHFNDILVNIIIMVSATIATIGILKPIVFNKIQNKHLRKVALASSSVAACYLQAFIYFLTEGWNLKYYPMAAIALSFCCIAIYWLYENTCLRNLIELVGGLALRKVLGVLKIASTTDDVDKVKAEIKNASVQLKDFTKQELKKATGTTKVDKDLKNL